jgi:hypothetical protein
VVEVLRVSAGDGRLTAEELDERVEAALTARTYNELAALVADLPNAPGAAVSMPAARPGRSCASTASNLRVRPPRGRAGRSGSG